jgi:polyhydroxyalkanoate synthesis regulator phasin
MTRIQKIAAGAVALVAVSGAGAAVAATQLRSPEEESRAVVNDAARELGVTPERLSNALKTAMKNRIDEAVEDGRLTQEQGNELKRAIDEEEVPMLGPRFGFRGGPGFHEKRHFGPHLFAQLDVAAEYLGMTEAALREALEDGKTLAQVARDRNKPVDGLIDALVAEKRERINDAVEDGDLTRAQADEILGDLRSRVADTVSGRFPRFHGKPRLDFHFSGLAAAAEYLGVSESALREQLEDGKTLAQVARDRNKPVDGLVDAIVAQRKERIDEAVEDGDLTRAQGNEILEDLRSRTTDLVNGRLPRFEKPGFHRFGPFGGERPRIEPSRDRPAVIVPIY